MIGAWFGSGDKRARPPTRLFHSARVQRAVLQAAISPFALRGRVRGVFVTDPESSARKALMPSSSWPRGLSRLRGRSGGNAPRTSARPGEAAASSVDMSARVTGRVADVTADLGDRVEAGTRRVKPLPTAWQRSGRSFRTDRVRQASAQGYHMPTLAMSVHQLTNQLPRKDWMAIRATDWAPKIEYPHVRIVRFREPYLASGREVHRIRDVEVRVYRLPRRLPMHSETLS